MEGMNPFRMMGRFDYASDYLLKKYNLNFNGDASDRVAFFVALSEYVNDYDRDFCLKMAQALYNSQGEMAAMSMSYNQFEADGQSRIGRQEAEYVFNQTHLANSYADMILAPTDYLPAIEDEKRKKAKERNRNIILVVAIIAVFVGGISVYNLPYFKEKRAFAELEKHYESGLAFDLEQGVKEYQEKYPDGKHIGEVLYMPVKFYQSKKEVIETLDAAEEYLKVAPDGEYADECRGIVDKIWESEIEKYKSSLPASGVTKGEDFVVEMLEYMKANNVRTVRVEGNPTLLLKEYSEYPASIRRALEAISDYEASQTSALKAKLPDDLVTIKDKITLEEASSWIIDIVNALNSGFDDVLTPGFIRFEKSDSSNEKDARMPVAKVNYTVKTGEGAYGDPDIWEYTHNFISTKLFLGISMTFDMNLILPGTDITYNLKGSGTPGTANFENIDATAIYVNMCSRITKEFADKIASEFGLPAED